MLLLSLLAILAVGPERTMPAAATQPVSDVTAVATTIGNDFLVVWRGPNALFAERVDGSTGVPSTPSMISRSAYGFSTASAGEQSIVAWIGNQAKPSYALLDRDLHVRATGQATNGTGNAIAVAAMGDRYVIAWRTADGAATRVIDASSGAPIGGEHTLTITPAPYTVGFSIASNGSTALLIIGTQPINAVVVTRDGSLGTLRTIGSGNTSPLVAWDGTAYIVAWQSVIVALDSGGAPLRTTGVNNVTPEAIVGTGNGSTIISAPSNILRLGPGGTLIDSAARSLLFEDRFDTLAVAFNGGNYLLVASSPFRTAIANGDDRPRVSVAAYQVPSQWMPVLASGATLFFAATFEGGATTVYRFDGQRFLDAGVGVGGVVDFGLAANGDTAAAVTTSGDFFAHFVGRDGPASSALFLAAGGAGACTSHVDGVAPIRSDLFLQVDRTDCESFGYYSPHYYRTNGSLFDATYGVRRALSFPDAFAATLTRYRDHAMLAYLGTDNVIRMAEVQANGEMDGVRVTIDRYPGPFAPPRMEIATDDADHALVTIEGVPAIYVVRFGPGTVTRIPWSGRAHVTWDGSEFIAVGDDLTIARFTSDGTPLGERFQLTTPFYVHDVRIASGPAGTAIGYLRSAADLGLGEVDRLFVRVITPAPPKHHAVGR